MIIKYFITDSSFMNENKELKLCKYLNDSSTFGLTKIDLFIEVVFEWCTNLKRKRVNIKIHYDYLTQVAKKQLNIVKTMSKTYGNKLC